MSEEGQWTEGKGIRRGINAKRDKGLDMGRSGGKKHGRTSGVRHRIINTATSI